MLQDLREPNHPWRKLDVDIRELRSKEERALSVRNVDNFRNLGLQLLGVLNLLVEVLGLEKMVERGDDISIDLEFVSPSST